MTKATTHDGLYLFEDVLLTKFPNGSAVKDIETVLTDIRDMTNNECMLVLDPACHGTAECVLHFLGVVTRCGEPKEVMPLTNSKYMQRVAARCEYFVSTEIPASSDHLSMVVYDKHALAVYYAKIMELVEDNCYEEAKNHEGFLKLQMFAWLADGQEARDYYKLADDLVEQLGLLEHPKPKADALYPDATKSAAEVVKELAPALGANTAPPKNKAQDGWWRCGRGLQRHPSLVEELVG